MNFTQMIKRTVCHFSYVLSLKWKWNMLFLEKLIVTSKCESGLQCDEPQPEQLAKDRVDPSRGSEEDLHRGQVHAARLQQHAWSTGHLQGTSQSRESEEAVRVDNMLKCVRGDTAWCQSWHKTLVSVFWSQQSESSEVGLWAYFNKQLIG